MSYPSDGHLPVPALSRCHFSSILSIPGKCLFLIPSRSPSLTNNIPIISLPNTKQKPFAKIPPEKVLTSLLT